MHVDSVGYEADFDELSPGTLFAFQLRDEQYIGLKTVERAQNREHFGCAVLCPGHPQLNNMPGHYQGNVVSSAPVLALPDICFVVSRERAHWSIGGMTEATLGDVVISGTDVILLIGSSRPNSLHVNVRTGEIVFQLARPRPALVHQWSLITLPPAHSETIFHFKRV
jgi:hypothetical protein